MVFMKFISLVLVAAALVLGAGCGRKAKDITELERKQAANLASEAQFAITLRDYARAEPLFAQAAELCPDDGQYWVNLGVARVRLGNKSGAKSAYEKALAAYRDAAKEEPEASDPVLQEIYVLTLLGRPEDARKRLDRLVNDRPNDRAVRAFSQDKQLDRILADPTFKEITL